MLTFAPPTESPSLTAGLRALAAWFAPAPSGQAQPAVRDVSPAAVSAPRGPEPAEHLADSAHASYWPCERLNAFILQMAARGHCVNAAMMLGHRAYAEQQLARAMAQGDEALRALAAELHAYFDVPPESAALRLRSSTLLPASPAP